MRIKKFNESLTTAGQEEIFDILLPNHKEIGADMSFWGISDKLYRIDVYYTDDNIDEVLKVKSIISKQLLHISQTYDISKIKSQVCKSIMYWGLTVELYIEEK